MNRSIQIFERNFKLRMKNKNFTLFKITYPTLLKAIVESIDEVYDENFVLQQEINSLKISNQLMADRIKYLEGEIHKKEDSSKNVLQDYFDNVSAEQFKIDWENSVGKNQKNIGPTVEEYLSKVNK